MMKKEDSTTPTIDAAQLALGQIKETKPKVRADNLPRYHQDITYFSRPIVIKTPPIEVNNPILNKIGNSESVLVPISSWVREQLNIIEAFVRDHVVIPNELISQWPYRGDSFYKPIHDGRNMFMQIGLRCCYTTDLGCNTTSFPTYRRPTFGPGRYIFTFEVPHIYIGPHKDGFLYSVNFRVKCIQYDPRDIEPLGPGRVPPFNDSDNDGDAQLAFDENLVMIDVSKAVPSQPVEKISVTKPVLPQTVEKIKVMEPSKPKRRRKMEVNE